MKNSNLETFKTNTVDELKSKLVELKKEHFNNYNEKDSIKFTFI